MTSISNPGLVQATQINTPSLKYKGKVFVSIGHDLRYAFSKISKGLSSVANTTYQLAVATKIRTQLAAGQIGKVGSAKANTVKASISSLLTRFKISLQSVYNKVTNAEAKENARKVEEMHRQLMSNARQTYYAEKNQNLIDFDETPLEQAVTKNFNELINNKGLALTNCELAIIKALFDK